MFGLENIFKTSYRIIITNRWIYLQNHSTTRTTNEFLLCITISFKTKIINRSQLMRSISHFLITVIKWKKSIINSLPRFYKLSSKIKIKCAVVAVIVWSHSTFWTNDHSYTPSTLLLYHSISLERGDTFYNYSTYRIIIHIFVVYSIFWFRLLLYFPFIFLYFCLNC